ncbi:uncharacterized protein [Apostichopus japonicus]
MPISSTWLNPTDTMDVAKPLANSHGRKILCQVCGALSSGLHFGVFTCEGCKCFYRRSIREGANYACAKDRGCDITMETRNSCRYCRFQKCLTLGMSKEGIKLGRRPKVECDPLHQVYFRHNDPSIPTMAPTSSLPSQQWPHIAPVIQIKTEMSDECGFYASKPSPYRPTFTIKQEPEDSLYANSYQCQYNDHTPSPPFRSRSDPHSTAIDQWHNQTNTSIPRWKTEGGHRNSINPYYESTNDIPGCQPALAWTPMQASPDDSGRGSAEPLHWEDTGGTPNSLNIPDVQTGAIAAMAFANLYRDTTEGHNRVDSTKGKCTDRNNNEGEVSTEENQKSYIELLPREKPHKNSSCSDRIKVKGAWINNPSQQPVTQILSADLDSPKKEIPEKLPHHFQSFSNQESAPRKRSHSCNETQRGKTRKVTEAGWTAGNAASAGVIDILHDLGTAFTLMQRDILQLYLNYRREKSEAGSNTTHQAGNGQFTSYEFSEDFCQQKREKLKDAIQTFVKVLEDKNSDWISASVADQIPVSFITKICLLHESSKAELIQRGTVTDISTEEAACLTTLSLIYDKRLCKEGESINPEKQKLTNDIRDVLKGKGFGCQKLQHLLEQKHQSDDILS